jgi:hypothetical protein
MVVLLYFKGEPRNLDKYYMFQLIKKPTPTIYYKYIIDTGILKIQHPLKLNRAKSLGSHFFRAKEAEFLSTYLLYFSLSLPPHLLLPSPRIPLLSSWPRRRR